jgi:hypothetical protein
LKEGAPVLGEQKHEAEQEEQQLGLLVNHVTGARIEQVNEQD